MTDLSDAHSDLLAEIDELAGSLPLDVAFSVRHGRRYIVKEPPARFGRPTRRRLCRVVDSPARTTGGSPVRLLVQLDRRSAGSPWIQDLLKDMEELRRLSEDRPGRAAPASSSAEAATDPGSLPDRPASPPLSTFTVRDRPLTEGPRLQRW